MARHVKGDSVLRGRIGACRGSVQSAYASAKSAGASGVDGTRFGAAELEQQLRADRFVGAVRASARCRYRAAVSGTPWRNTPAARRTSTTHESPAGSVQTK
jgi:hypothetical protein